MTWKTKVPAWVIQVVGDFVIPDSASVRSETEFGHLDDTKQPVALQESQNTAQFPGLIPEFKFGVQALPTVNGINYRLRAYKGVGFYGVRVKIDSYDNTRINSWTYPLERKKFGFCSLSRAEVIFVDSSIGYSNQLFVADGILSLCSNYDTELDSQNLRNEVDKFCLTRFDCVLSPTVKATVSFLPVYEVWELRFFRDNST